VTTLTDNSIRVPQKVAYGRARSSRAVVGVGVAGNVFIAAGAFRLSFAALADLAHRAGLDASEAWVWPLIVDGVIVVATVAVVALHQHGLVATRYPWVLLLAATGVSVTANATHALVTADASVPTIVAACVAAVPPLVLLATTHLTVELIRWSRTPTGDGPLARAELTSTEVSRASSPHKTITARRGRAKVSRISAFAPGSVEAMRLQGNGWSNRRIAKHLGVHPSTVGRWLRNAAARPESTTTNELVPALGEKAAQDGGSPTGQDQQETKEDSHGRS
jgi:DNA-binding NarL/FixJ family response regulator